MLYFIFYANKKEEEEEDNVPNQLAIWRGAGDQ
jgi:hypothetical protein